MTVLMLSKNGKSVLIYTDEGEAFVTSVNFVQGLIMGKAPGNFITTKRLLNSIAPDRFKPSEVYDPNGVFKGNAAKTLEPLTTTNDALSVKVRAGNESAEIFKDKSVW